MADSTIGSWNGVLDNLRGLQPEIVVPGHGRAGGPELIVAQQHYFKQVTDEVDRAIASGRALAAEIPAIHRRMLADPSTASFVNDRHLKYIGLFQFYDLAAKIYHEAYERDTRTTFRRPAAGEMLRRSLPLPNGGNNVNTSSGMKSPRAISPLISGVAVGTVVVALLDATDGVIYFWLTAHLNPIEVLQYIASGAFGAGAYSGGLATAFAGLVFHFIISLVVVSVFAILYSRLRIVRNHAPAVGLAYGAVVWCVMNLIVLPLSAVAPAALGPLAVIHGLIGHALFVGLAAALSIRRYTRDVPAVDGASNAIVTSLTSVM